MPSVEGQVPAKQKPAPQRCRVVYTSGGLDIHASLAFRSLSFLNNESLDELNMTLPSFTKKTGSAILLVPILNQACFLITHETGDSSIKHTFSSKAQPPGWLTDRSPHCWAVPVWRPLDGQLLVPAESGPGRGAPSPAETPTLQAEPGL